MILSAEQFHNHLVWTALSDLGPLIEEALIREGLDAPTLEELARLKSVLSFTGKRLAGADPYLFQPSFLDSISTSIATSATHVRSFISNGNVAHVAAANVEADKALNSLAQLNVQTSTEDFVAAKEAAESYRLSFKKIFEDIQGEATQIHSNYESFKLQLSELATEEATLKIEFNDAQVKRLGEWEKEQKERIEEFEAFISENKSALTEEREQLSKLAIENQTHFAASQEAQLSEWKDSQKKREDDLVALVTKYSGLLENEKDELVKFKGEMRKLHSDYLDKMTTEFVDSANKIRDALLERQKEADVLLGIIGDRGVTSGHQKAADEARDDSRIWQIVTVVSMIGLIVLAVMIFLPQIAGAFSWESFAGRVFITFTIGILAAYAGSQADKYQKIERYSRNLALELQAIGPYIAPLPQDKQDEFRLKIGDRTFGREVQNGLNIDHNSPTSIAEVISKSKDLTGFATELIKTTADVMKGK